MTRTITTRTVFPLWLALMALCLIAPVMAATPLNETRPLHPQGRFILSTNHTGDIEIKVWDRPEVHLEGTLADGVETFSMTGHDRKVEVEIRYPDETASWFGLFSFRRPGRSDSSRLQITLPRTANIEVKNVRADIEVAGVAGRTLTINSISGDITGTGTPHEADIENVSGTIQLELDGSREVSAKSVSGDVNVRGHLSGKITLTSVSGNLAIDTRGEAVERLNLDSVSGSARLNTALAQNGRIDVTTVSGTIRFIAPTDLSAQVNASSFSGRIHLPNIDARHRQDNRNIEHRYGGGEGDVKLESLSGNIDLKLGASAHGELDPEQSAH